MEVTKGSLYGSSLVGLFALANETYCFMPPGVKSKIFAEALDVEIKRTLVGNTRLLGLFCAGNSNGVLIPYDAEEDFPFNHARLKIKENALGNLILCNDNGAVISEKLTSVKAVIEKVLGVKTTVGTIAGQDIVGAYGACNNKGVVLHPEVTDEELGEIEDILGVKADVSTVNMGSPHLGSGIVANSKGVVIGKLSSIHELIRIEETLE